ncbi:MAG: hypothetical protein QM756_33305 [Polyangiaceae bacterium]
MLTSASMKKPTSRCLAVVLLGFVVACRANSSPSDGANGGQLVGGASGGASASGGGGATGGNASGGSAGESGASNHIVLDGNQIRNSNVNGFTFKGFGVLSANGTSELLMDYKAEQPEKYAGAARGPVRWHAAPIMTHVKIEMGNDRNNSTGPDPATMRTRRRGSRTCGGTPAFSSPPTPRRSTRTSSSASCAGTPLVGRTRNEQIYVWFKATILEAYRSYGVMVDYVNPGVNESAADLDVDQAIRGVA